MQTDVETYENMHDVCLLELQLPPPQRTSLKSLGHMVGQVVRGKSDKRDKGDKSKPGKHIRRGDSAGRHIQVFLKCSRRHCPYTEPCGHRKSDGAFTFYEFYCTRCGSALIVSSNVP